MENNPQENDEIPSSEIVDNTNDAIVLSQDERQDFDEVDEPADKAITSTESLSTADTINKKRKRFNLNVVPFFSGLILIVLFYYFVIPALPKGSFLQRLFLPDGKPSLLSTGVPITALFFFLWSIFDMLIVLIGVRNEKKLLLINNFLLTGIDISFGYFDKVDKSWKGSKLNRTFQRIYSLSETLETTKNRENIHEFFRYQSDVDTDKAASKYAFTKIAIWAMPILGFIGTVLGIGLAVGNFSSFLSQDIDKIDVIKLELSKVATGLSFAFYSTLFGLVLSMFAMFLTTFVQNFEEKYLTQLEETCFSIIEKFKVGDTVQASTVTTISPLDIDNILHKFNIAIDEKVKQVAMNISTLIGQLEISANNISSEFVKIPKHVGAYTDGLITQLQSSAKSISTEFESVPLQVKKYTDGLITQLETSATGISTEFGKIPPLMEKNNEQFKATAEIITERLEEMKKGFVEIEKKSREVYNVDLGPVLDELVKIQKAILPVLETLTNPTEIIVTTRKELKT